MSYSADGKSILIVEDEPIICEICMQVLGKEGYEVEMAANGQEGADRLKERSYDLIIIDIRTPVMDGGQLYLKIRKDHPDMTGQIIMTSGELGGGDMRSFMEKYGIPFLPKPFTSEELRKAARDALEGGDN